eukprot:3106605-Pyramimonas_sp.AAC.1
MHGAMGEGQDITTCRLVAPKDHYPFIALLRHSYEHVDHAKQHLRKPNTEACNAMIFNGRVREFSAQAKRRNDPST